MIEFFKIELKFEKERERILKRSLSFVVLFTMFCIGILITDVIGMYNNSLSKWGFMSSGILLMAKIYIIFTYIFTFVEWVESKKRITEFENIISRHDSDECIDRIIKYNESMDIMFNKHIGSNENAENKQPESELPEREI